MYELKKRLERYLRVNLLGPGPILIKKRIYRAAARPLRNTGLEPSDFWDRPLELNLCSLLGLSSMGLRVSKQFGGKHFLTATRLTRIYCNEFTVFWNVDRWVCTDVLKQTVTVVHPIFHSIRRHVP